MIEKIEKVKNIIVAVIMAIVIIVVALTVMTFFTGCLTSPDRANFQIDECYYSALCMYYNQKNHDKSACSELSKNCANAAHEKRIQARVKYCGENAEKFNNDQERCRLYLNQK